MFENEYDRNPVQQLARDSLKKWQNDNVLFWTECAFCRDAVARNHNGNSKSDCKICLCPKKLCHKNGHGGLVGKIFKSEHLKNSWCDTTMARISVKLRVKVIAKLTKLAEGN